MIFEDAQTKKQFLIESSINTKETAVYEADGKTYPVIRLEVASILTHSTPVHKVMLHLLVKLINSINVTTLNQQKSKQQSVMNSHAF